MKIEIKRWSIILSILSLTGMIFILLFSFLEFPAYRVPWIRYGRPPLFHIYLLPVFLILTIFTVIPLSYYFVSKRLEEKLELNMKVISKLIGKKESIQKEESKRINDRSIILRFLNPIERKVLEKLIENKGTTLQKDISRMEGMTKLKTHRAVKSLEMKGIIKTKQKGKTKLITLSKEVKDIFNY